MFIELVCKNSNKEVYEIACCDISATMRKPGIDEERLSERGEKAKRDLSTGGCNMLDPHLK